MYQLQVSGGEHGSSISYGLLGGGVWVMHQLWGIRRVSMQHVSAMRCQEGEYVACTVKLEKFTYNTYN